MNNANFSYRGWKIQFEKTLLDSYDKREIDSLFFGVLEMLGLSKMDFILNDQILTTDEQQKILTDSLERLLKEEPLQYITGQVFFDDLIFKIDHRALIPRPETEELVNWIAKRHTQAKSILDCCTGSGCIALSLKNRLPEAKVFGCDLSSDALSLARENQKQLDLAVSFFKGDALGSWKEMKGQTYDVIVSNPPYIPQSDDRLMHKNVLEHEPHMALFVEDEDPLLFYREIAKRALLHLKAGGYLYYEIHEDFPEEMMQLMEDLGYVDVLLKKDLQGKDRMLSAQKRA